MATNPKIKCLTKGCNKQGGYATSGYCWKCREENKKKGKK